jgi:hypothetical protein
MNATLSNTFLANLPKAICESYKPIRMTQSNTVFLHMCNWFITKYGRTMTKDCKANWQRMAATWHPSKGFEPLTMYLFIGTSYASTARYPMDDHDVIDIGLHVIKHCGMYAKEYKNLASRKNLVPPIIKMIKSFKEYWANTTALFNQTAVLALQHGYGMTAMDDDALVASYSDLLTNFGAVYTTTQETMKSQTDSLVTMQNQLANIKQFCMIISQQPPSSGYAPAQQQCTFTNHNKCNGGGQSNGGGFPQQSIMNYGSTGSSQQHPLPKNIGRIGTTVTPTVVILTTITPVHHVANQDLHTTLTRAAPTSYGRIGCRNAQDHLAQGLRPHSTQSLPPAAAVH